MNTHPPSAPFEATARKLAIATGIFFLITHVTSVGASFLYGPILNDPGYVTGPGPDTSVLMGVFFEVILAMANIGTAVALFPVARRHSEGLALGYVGLRTLEAAVIAVGVIPLLAVVTLRQNLAGMAGTDTAGLVTLGGSLVELYKWTLVVGPGLICGTNTVVMAYLLFRSRLVPRFIPTLGLIGGPLVFAYHTAGIFGLAGQIGVWAAILVIPIFTWEVSLALRLIFKGFNGSAMQSASAFAAKPETDELLSAV